MRIFAPLAATLLFCALGHEAQAFTSWHDQGTTALGGTDTRSMSSPAVNTLYSCEFTALGGSVSGSSWVSSSGTISFASKSVISGSVSWTSYYKAVISGTTRLLMGNGLPTHTTGTYPSTGTTANPNSIGTVRQYFAPPSSPTYSNSPSCVRLGAIGIALTGATIYNPLDANGRDAVAYEYFDGCEGHPDSGSQYHYHHLSPCMSDSSGSSTTHSSQIGWILDGYGLYGPYAPGYAAASSGKLTNSDLDACHGHTHSVTDTTGTTSTVYHYHAVEEFPYIIGCYRGSSNTATGTTLTSPNNGFWWTSTASGRGFGMEVQGSSMFIAIYTYDSSGNDIWYVSSCTLTTTTCTGGLTSYSGGTKLSNIGIAATPPTSSSTIGSMTLTVNSSTTATVAITLNGSSAATTYSLTRFPISGSTVQSAPSWAPQTGWWWNSTYSGIGFFLENQGTTTSAGTTTSSFFMVAYAYGSDGSGKWYAGSGSSTQTGTSTSLFSGSLNEYANGPTLTGSSGSTTLLADKGSGTITFTSSTTATFTLSNGQSIPLTRYSFF